MTLHALFQSATAAAVSAASLASSAKSNGAIRYSIGIASGEAPTDLGLASCAISDLALALAEIAAPGQILLAMVAASLLRRSLPPEFGIREMGSFQVPRQAAPEPLSYLTHFDLLHSESPLLEQTAVNTLPWSFGYFIGRDEEKDRAHALLEGARLLTVLGTAGVGKSHFACRVASECLETWAEGAIWIDLAGARGSDLWDRLQAALLPARLEARATAEDVLKTLRGRSLLIVLDGADLASEAVRELIIPACNSSGPRFIVTSTRRLGIASEGVLRLGGLFAPPEGVEVEPSELEEYDATALFLDRVRSVRPNFGLDHEDIKAIVSICNSFSGNPLAIVLAARLCQRVRPKELAARLTKVVGRVGRERHMVASRRHESVLAALEWSVRSLEATDRELLYAASTMSGDWTVRDVAAIADLDIGQAHASVLRSVDAGLVEPQVSAGSDARYRMPGILRRLIHAELDRDAQAALSERHCLHLIGILCQGVSHLKGPDRLHWLDLLDRYRQDLAKAFEFTLHRRDHPSTLVDAMVLSWSYWYDRNRTQEALELIRRAIRACPDKTHLDVARLLNIAGILCGKSGTMSEGRRYFRRALRICSKGRHELLRASLWSNLGALEWADAEPARAARSFDRGIRCLRGLSCPLHLGKALVSSVDALAELGRLQEARAATEEADTLLRAREDPLDELTISMARGEIALAEANPSQAARIFTRCLELARGLGDMVTYSRICLWLASAEVLLGNYEGAGELLGAMESHASCSGAHFYRTHVLRLARVEGAVRGALGEKALSRAKLIGAIGAPGILLDKRA